MFGVKHWPAIGVALLIQVGVLAGLVLGVWWAPYIFPPPYSPIVLVLIQATLAVMVSKWVGLPRWWLWIQFVFPIGLYVGMVLEFNPVWALLLCVGLWLVFRHALKERVPLYFTNSTTRQALKMLARQQSQKSQGVQFMDLGCGLGANVVFMAQQREVDGSTGVETAPIPYIWAKVYSWIGGGEIWAQDIWKTDLSRYTLVYAFLSPEPMSKLWEKVQKEMPKGAVFVSNSFAVPEREADTLWQLSDARQTILYVYYV